MSLYDGGAESDEEQYQALCYNCDRRLGTRVNIMCWESLSRKTERTYCEDCYWDIGAYKRDGNSDNEEEIVEAGYRFRGKKKKKAKMPDVQAEVGVAESGAAEVGSAESGGSSEVAIDAAAASGGDPRDLCDICGSDRGDHDVSERNRLIPCESDGEWKPDEEQCSEDFWIAKDGHLTFVNCTANEAECMSGNDGEYGALLSVQDNRRKPKMAGVEEAEVCYNCSCSLGPDFDIDSMYWKSLEESSMLHERTYCSICYWETGAYEQDGNINNEEQIVANGFRFRGKTKNKAVEEAGASAEVDPLEELFECAVCHEMVMNINGVNCQACDGCSSVCDECMIGDPEKGIRDRCLKCWKAGGFQMTSAISDIISKGHIAKLMKDLQEANTTGEEWWFDDGILLHNGVAECAKCGRQGPDACSFCDKCCGWSANGGGGDCECECDSLPSFKAKKVGKYLPPPSSPLTYSAYCESGEHTVQLSEMWRDFADCQNCATLKEYAETMDMTMDEAQAYHDVVITPERMMRSIEAAGRKPKMAGVEDGGLEKQHDEFVQEWLKTDRYVAQTVKRGLATQSEIHLNDGFVPRLIYELEETFATIRYYNRGGESQEPSESESYLLEYDSCNVADAVGDYLCEQGVTMHNSESSGEEERAQDLRASYADDS